MKKTLLVISDNIKIVIVRERTGLLLQQQKDEMGQNDPYTQVHV